MGGHSFRKPKGLLPSMGPQVSTVAWCALWSFHFCKQDDVNMSIPDSWHALCWIPVKSQPQDLVLVKNAMAN